MFVAEERLTACQREFVVYGYIRQNVLYTLPTELINLCLNFYDAEYHWKITGDTLTKIQSLKYGEFVYSEAIYYHNIQWRLAAAPTNRIHIDSSYIFIFAKLAKLPHNIQHIDILAKISIDNITSYTFII